MTTVWVCSPAVFTLVVALGKASKVIDGLPEGTSPVGILHALEQELAKEVQA